MNCSDITLPACVWCISLRNITHVIIYNINEMLNLEHSFVWALRKADQKQLRSSEIWCWWTMKISWPDRVRNKELQRVKEEKKILHKIKWGQTNWTGHVLHRNCFLKLVIEGKTEVTGRRGGRPKQLLDDLTETGRYWNRTLWGSCFVGGYGPHVRQNAWRYI
jgi:hypothetical protein